MASKKKWTVKEVKEEVNKRLGISQPVVHVTIKGDLARTLKRMAEGKDLQSFVTEIIKEYVIKRLNG